MQGPEDAVGRKLMIFHSRSLLDYQVGCLETEKAAAALIPL